MLIFVFKIVEQCSACGFMCIWLDFSLINDKWFLMFIGRNMSQTFFWFGWMFMLHVYPTINIYASAILLITSSSID